MATQLTPVVASNDGPKVTVNSLIKNPRVLPRRVISMLENNFLADSLLRDGGGAPGGAVVFEESTPQFPLGEIGIREEFGEYPILTTVAGQQRVALAVDRGFSVMVSEEMRRRQQMDRVNLQIQQGKNLMTKVWDGVLRNAILASNVPSITVPKAWTDSASKIRTDLLDAKYAVSSATLEDTKDGENFFGFNADTMVCSVATANLLMGNDDIERLFRGNTADQSILYKGKLPNKIYDLNILTSRTWPDNQVLVCERNTLGFISDEVGLNSTPLYQERPSVKTWRSDTGRTSAIGIDQPKSAVILKGVTV